MKRLPLVLAVTWLGLVVLASLSAPWLSPANPLAVNPFNQSLIGPSSEHLFGTDVLGRDVYSRMLWGGQRTLGMALLAVILSGAGGVGLGLIAGYAGEPWDGWLMRGLEVALALPQLLVALIVVAALGSHPWSVGLAVGLAGIASFARLARSAVLQVRGQNYVQAAEALGMGPLHMAVRHVFPNIAGPLAAFAAIHFAWAILNTATLTFLGFGGPLSTPDWGTMLNEGRAYLLRAPWVSTAPGLAISLTMLAVNTLGNVAGEAKRRGETRA